MIFWNFKRSVDIRFTWALRVTKMFRDVHPPLIFFAMLTTETVSEPIKFIRYNTIIMSDASLYHVTKPTTTIQ